jgi:signal transduction histidine kinase
VDRLNLGPAPAPTGWQLDAEAVAVKIRWFGLVLGYLYANLGTPGSDSLPLNLILAVGFGFTALASYYYSRGHVFLGSYPLLISCMEALFIGLLCYFDRGLDSPFRFYYLLSLICAAIRYPPAITGITCALDALSFGVLYLALPPDRRDAAAFAGMLILLAWVTWAAAALARLLHRIGAQLEENQSLLERRIAERTRELQESQAQVLHQEKMAAFGLLAAGIAHEVGNPLTSISTLIQLLERRDLDDYTRERLGLVNSQLTRIQTILRELVTFGRPASDTRGRVSLREIVDDALGIAKYYKGVKSREVRADVSGDLPPLVGVRDQLVQVFFNLILNAIDATGKGGKVVVEARAEGNALVATVTDDGHGIAPEHRERLFRPYFTTKRHGTGLGLFVTHKLVQAHGGTVTCDSTPDRGTTFRLVFPITQSAGTTVPGLAAG